MRKIQKFGVSSVAPWNKQQQQHGTTGCSLRQRNIQQQASLVKNLIEISFLVIVIWVYYALGAVGYFIYIYSIIKVRAIQLLMIYHHLNFMYYWFFSHIIVWCFTVYDFYSDCFRWYILFTSSTSCNLCQGWPGRYFRLCLVQVHLR